MLALSGCQSDASAAAGSSTGTSGASAGSSSTGAEQDVEHESVRLVIATGSELVVRDYVDGALQEALWQEPGAFNSVSLFGDRGEHSLVTALEPDRTVIIDAMNPGLLWSLESSDSSTGRIAGGSPKHSRVAYWSEIDDAQHELRIVDLMEQVETPVAVSRKHVLVSFVRAGTHALYQQLDEHNRSASLHIVPVTGEQAPVTVAEAAPGRELHWSGSGVRGGLDEHVLLYDGAQEEPSGFASLSAVALDTLEERALPLLPGAEWHALYMTAFRPHHEGFVDVQHGPSGVDLAWYDLAQPDAQPEKLSTGASAGAVRSEANGWATPRWSDDGRWLLYYAGTPHHLYVVPWADEHPGAPIDVGERLGGRVSPSSEYLYTRKPVSADAVELRRHVLSDGTVGPAQTLVTMPLKSSFRVADDERSLIYTQEQEGEVQAWLVRLDDDAATSPTAIHGCAGPMLVFELSPAGELALCSYLASPTAGLGDRLYTIVDLLDGTQVPISAQSQGLSGAVMMPLAKPR